MLPIKKIANGVVNTLSLGHEIAKDLPTPHPKITPHSEWKIKLPNNWGWTCSSEGIYFNPQLQAGLTSKSDQIAPSLIPLDFKNFQVWVCPSLFEQPVPCFTALLGNIFFPLHPIGILFESCYGWMNASWNSYPYLQVFILQGGTGKDKASPFSGPASTRDAESSGTREASHLKRGLWLPGILTCLRWLSVFFLWC